MTTPAPGGVSRLSAQDLARLKKYLLDNIARSIEAEGIKADERNAFIRQRIEAVYAQTNLKLPDTVRDMIFTKCCMTFWDMGQSSRSWMTRMSAK